MLKANEMKVLRKTVGKTKIYRIRIQQDQRILWYPTNSGWKKGENGTNM
jgi:hypothetical protein